MDDLKWVFELSFFELRYFDLTNFFICILFIIVLSILNKTPVMYSGVLILHCIIPFISYGVLFSYDYMPDILKYWSTVNDIRHGELSIIGAFSAEGNIPSASAFFSLMPLPFVVSPLSLGFYSKFIYIGLFFWLYKKNIFTPVSIWFYLLYPSLALYSGLGLRDNLILLFMMVFTQWARERQWLYMALSAWSIYMIKFQNFYIVVPALILYVVFKLKEKGLSLISGITIAFIAIISLALLSPLVLPVINKFRVSMFVEDGGDKDMISLINTPADFVFEGVTSGFYFLMKPFIWEAGNLLQLVQSIENIFVVLFLAILIKVAWILDKSKLIYWVLFIVFALSIYGLVVFNYGTATRYRFPFIVMFVVFLCADCNVKSMKIGGSR